ncbi:krox-like protein, putative [Plasmodium gallinaceum]|uniref:Oxidation resistance protein 1 n=1 Tax=Plasmodium gallinaceum TaxID=5849 RepID=A0A1J1GVV3_PLAGA|nr:krox-like protein, putative [Plasmodium gallinaceum]CRG95147.1 krox-like protein, putative [Plasmodium gallinaceum]
MGEGYSKNTLKYGNLSEKDVENIRKKFNLNKKEINEKVSTLDFIYVYPHILRPYIALVLPSFHEVLRKKGKKNKEKLNNYGFNYAINILFNKNSKKLSNEISLQEIINILSYINNRKSRVIIRILFMSFLRYSISNNNESDKVRIINENASDNNKDIDKLNINNLNINKLPIENDKKEDDLNMIEKEDSSYNNEPNIYNNENDKEELSRLNNSLKFVLSDSNVNIINKNSKRERNYKFINDNIFFLDKNKIKYHYPKNYNVKDLISVEEALHHLFTYMYIEQLYLLCPCNLLFKITNKNQISEKKIFLNKSKSNLNEDFIINRKNSWDLTFFFKELFFSLETNLDFRNIIIGFRLYVNSIDSSKHSIYYTMIEYINSNFVNLSNIYADATFKHFTDNENIITNEKKKEENAEENNITNFNDICINSIELIHSIYTNMKKNEIKNQESKESLSKEDTYKKSSSILEIQNETNGWRGLFLNKTSKILTDEIVFSLRQCSTCFTNNEWYRLYASWKQGISFNRFINSVFHYPSPIVIVIKTDDNQILGGVCTTPLKDSHLFHGSSNDFLFSAYPVFRIIRTNHLGNNYVYLNSKNSFYPKGLGFGGKTECFRLFLSDEFKESYCTQSDYTYKSGHLYFPHHKKEKDSNNIDDDDDDDVDSFLCKLSINEVEAWGCGNEKSLEEQRLSFESEEACKQERRSIDKSKIVQNSFDKEFLLPKVFVGGNYDEFAHDS